MNRSKRERIFKRDGWACLLCGTKKHLTVDHIIPKAWGGNDHESNLQTLCEYHNRAKGSRSSKDYRGRKGLKSMDPYLCEG